MRVVRPIFPVLALLAWGCSSASPAPPPPARPAASAPAAAPRSFTVEVIGSGSPMILIPGLACSGEVWRGAVEHFRATHQLHVVTLAGFAGQPAIGAPFLDRVRRDLIQYIRDQRLVRPVVVGHSLGGFLGFWIAATAPELVGGVIAVDGVPFLSALMDPTATAATSQAIAGQIRDQMAAQTREQFAAQNRRALTGMITAPADVDRVAATSGRSDPAAVGLAVYEIMTTDLRPSVSAIRSPTLLVAAAGQAADPRERDQIAARYEQQIASIPVHRVAVAARARHFVMLDDPAFLFGQMDAFLRDPTASR
ncbi:MAG TPA: alpha/beta fold hydrolase [Kofleriaceae bacterium]|nr:alpha/beta fold hydrolase [Kofleriaceae bacterium]